MMKLKRNIGFVIAVCTIAIIFSVSFIRNFDNSSVPDDHFQLFTEPSATTIEQASQTETLDDKIVVVDVKGAVIKPGVYEMNLGQRVVHAIEKAGGFLKDANQDVINLALLLEDEMVVFVPKIGDDVIEIEGTNISAVKDNGKINVNAATAEELQKIPGIGPAKASAIISYRDENGKFKNIEDLIKVTGIGKKTVEKMSNFIVVK
jgi:competence protein ComEA